MSVTLLRLRAIQPAEHSDNRPRYASSPCCEASKSHETQRPMTVTIRPYQAADWARLCEIHDAARLDELGQTVGKDAFLTLEQTAENEGLFDNQLFVADVDQKIRGFVAYSEDIHCISVCSPPKLFNYPKQYNIVFVCNVWKCCLANCNKWRSRPKLLCVIHLECFSINRRNIGKI